MYQSVYNTPPKSNHVTCQEVGHTLGLGYQDESGASFGTFMDYSSSLNSQHPNQPNYDELIAIYSPVDSTSASYSAV